MTSLGCHTLTGSLMVEIITFSGLDVSHLSSTIVRNVPMRTSVYRTGCLLCSSS